MHLQRARYLFMLRGSKHPQKYSYLCRRTSTQASPLYYVSLHCFCIRFFLRRKKSQKHMELLKGQCHLATLWLNYMFGALSAVSWSNPCPPSLPQPGSYGAGEDRPGSPQSLLLPGIPPIGKQHLKLGVRFTSHRTRSSYSLLFQSRDLFSLSHCLQI